MKKRQILLRERGCQATRLRRKGKRKGKESKTKKSSSRPPTSWEREKFCMLLKKSSL